MLLSARLQLPVLHLLSTQAWPSPTQSQTIPYHITSTLCMCIHPINRKRSLQKALLSGYRCSGGANPTLRSAPGTLQAAASPMLQAASALQLASSLLLFTQCVEAGGNQMQILSSRHRSPSKRNAVTCSTLKLVADDKQQLRLSSWNTWLQGSNAHPANTVEPSCINFIWHYKILSGVSRANLPSKQASSVWWYKAR